MLILQIETSQNLQFLKVKIVLCISQSKFQKKDKTRQDKTRPRTEQNRTEQNRTEQNRTEQNRKEKKLESKPFPRARVKLGGRVSSYQVTQPLTYIFEPLTVAEIQGLLQTLFMYAQCQHPQPLVT